MKKIYGKRIIALTITFLLLISFTSLGYKLGFDNYVFASEMIYKQNASGIAAIAGYLALQYNKVDQTIENVAGYIDKAKTTYDKIYQGYSASTKVVHAMVFGNDSIDKVNTIYGTSYSQSTIQSLGIETMRQKIADGEPLTSYEMELLGIYRLTANTIKSDLATNAIRNDGVYQDGSYSVRDIVVGGRTYKMKSFNVNDCIFSSLPFKVSATQSIIQYGGSSAGYLGGKFTYFLNYNEQYYKIELIEEALWDRAKSFTIGVTAPRTGYIDLYSMENGIWVKNTNLMSSRRGINASSTDLLHELEIYTGLNLSTHPQYGASIYKILPMTWIGNNVKFGDATADYSAIAIGAETLVNQGSNDTSISQAERIIDDIAAQGENAQSIDIGVTSYPNQDTGDEDIVISPDGVPATDTGSTDIDVPDTSGDTNINEDGTGMLNIPILGTILKWLQKIWQMAKDIYDLVLNHFQNPASSDSGTDWGNFTNFFDIFWIFYYLIIIAILILLKFFSVIMTMLSIPANTALFEQYPTMLTGLNYIKNIKVGGFNVTLQTIFEYMFTVFFFAYIVITLQKLYHSITGIERQSARENKDIKIDTNDINKQYTEYSSFNKDLYNKEIYGNDKSVDNIKFTGWGDK